MPIGLRSSSGPAAPPYSNGPYTWDQNLTMNSNLTVNGTFTFGDAAADNFIVQGDLRINDDRNLHFGTDEDASMSFISASSLVTWTGVTLRFGTTVQLQFRDAALLINSSADGQLDIDADVMLQIGTLTTEIRSTDVGATGPILRLNHAGGTQANADVVGRILFRGQDNAGTPAAEDYGQIDVVVQDVTAANPDADMIFYVDVAGTLTEKARCLNTLAGFQIGGGAASAILQSSGDFDLVLRTGNATTGNITITDGAAGAITLTPDGAGIVAINNGTDPVTLRFDGAQAGFNNEITDVNGNEILALQGVASAVNEFTMTNAVEASAPTLSVQGGTANISARIGVKGSGYVLTSGPIHPYTTTASTAIAGPETYSASWLLGGIIVRDCGGAGRTDTLDTAANIVNSMQGAAIGDTVRCLVVNGSDAAETITIATGAGGSVDILQSTASQVIAQSASKTLHIRITNVATPAYVVYI